MCVCFGRVSLHCFNSCTPGIIYGPVSSCCMRVASRWNYNDECMINIFWGGGGRGGDTFDTPSPLRTTFAFTHPCFKMFLERSLNDPHHPTSSIFHCYPLPIHHPFSIHKNVDHTLRCSAFYGVYNMSVVSVMFMMVDRTEIILYTQE